MRMYDIIIKKRNGEALTDEEIAFFIKGYTDGSIPDYQASAGYIFHGNDRKRDCSPYNGDGPQR